MTRRRSTIRLLARSGCSPTAPGLTATRSWAIQKAGIVRQGTPIGDIRVPTLVLVGRDDTLVGPPEPLAAAIPGSRVQVVEGDHLSAVVDPAFSKAIVDFLG